MRIELLGEPVITIAGRPLVVDTRKALAVLAMLAIEGVCSRQLLAARLWPHSDDVHARGALRRTLSVLNGALDGRWLAIDRARVALCGDGLTLDLTMVADRLRETHGHGHTRSKACGGCLTPLREAADLHRGPLLAGFSLRDAAEFDEWLGVHQEQHRRELVGVLERLTRLEIEGDELDDAQAHAERWLAIDPLDERAHGRLMLVHGLRGERAAAISRYRDCEATLARELGVTPLSDTAALLEAILDGRLGRPAPSVPWWETVVTSRAGTITVRQPGPA